MKNSFVLLLICILSGSTGFSQTQKGDRYFGENLRPGAGKTKPELTIQTHPTGKYDNYSGRIGIGIGVSIFDALGVPVRYYPSPRIVIEGGIYYGLIAASDDYGVANFQEGLMFGSGFTFFGNRSEKENKSKIRAHGLALRLNYLTGDYSTTILSAGWAMETFKKDHPKRSFIFELGVRTPLPGFENYTDILLQTLYLRFHWNFFVK